jgi:hypothetical protein
MQLLWLLWLVHLIVITQTMFSSASRAWEYNKLAIRHSEALCTMECQARACPWCWARHRAGLLGRVRWHAHHNGQGDAFPWHFEGLGWQIQQFLFFFDKFIFNRHFGHFYECIMVIVGRLCHAICSRKWCNLPPQIFNVMEPHCLENPPGKYVNLKEEWVFCGPHYAWSRLDQISKEWLPLKDFYF